MRFVPVFRSILLLSLLVAGGRVIAGPMDSDYLFIYFDGGDRTGLRLAGSDDGYKWTPYEGNPVYNPKIGAWKMFRDPSFDIDPKDGSFHMVWTTGSDGFGYARSTDMLTWTDEQYIEIEKGDLAGKEAIACWAPEIMYDSDLDEFIIVFSAATERLRDNRFKHRMYYMLTQDRDFSKLTDPVSIMSNIPDWQAVIDGALFKEDGKYYIFYKHVVKSEEDYTLKDAIHYQWSSTLAFDYDKSSERLPGAQDNGEGSSPIKIGNRYFHYFDHPINRSHDYGLNTTTSIEDPSSWTVESASISGPAPGYDKVRHGTIRYLGREGDGESKSLE